MGADMFQERLKLCMSQKDLSGAELAVMSGVSAATISRYLSGLRCPTVENLSRIAAALNASSDYLLGLNDVPDGKKLIDAYSVASCDDKRVIWTLLERYGGNE